MDLRVAIIPRHAYAAPRLAAFADGLRAHGIEPDADPADCDLAVVWGVGDRAVIERQANQGRDVLVMEQGYIGDRAEYTSCGFNGLNGRADFVLNNMPRDRWQKHKDLLRPWRKRGSGEFIVIMGQLPGDQALSGVDFRAWVHSSAAWFGENAPDVRVVYRQHPNGSLRVEIPEVTGSLEQCLKHAAMVVTFNSNSGVDGALAGVPVIAVDAGSMARAVAAHELTINPPRPDRAQWARELAYCQWTTAEIADGRAWDHLKWRYQ